MKIYLKPHSGLANRIRVMVSGISLAEKLNCKLEIIWEKDKGLGCEFNDLFIPNNDLVVTKKNWKTDVLDNVRAKPFFLSLAKRIVQIGFVLYDKGMQEYVWSTGTNNLDLKKINNKGKDIYIKSCHEFYFRKEHLRYFVPVEKIQQQIDLNTKMFTRHTIGIHIRRTDHARAIAESPIEDFKHKMLAEIEDNSDVTFYVATDDEAVRNELIYEFGDRIFYANTILNRNSKEGIQGAMIDLYSLSRTSKIYGSFWSSYSDIAARIGSIPLVVVKK